MIMDVHSGIYEICVLGALDEQWSDWFSGMEMIVVDDGQVTTLTGRVDQAALRGILNRLWDLNRVLIGVKRLDGLS
jgi:hypothetical protein